MYLTSLELIGFKSFGRKVNFTFTTPITAIVGPNGSGKSNSAEAFRFVLGEQSLKSLRGKRGEDLIWNGSSEVARSSRAAVRVVFDNTPRGGTRLLNVDFDEVTIERTVFRDGQNEYAINGSKVRLKDVVELLAGANIGASGHHIISQGEADRVLAASPKERRHMIEDALGLRVYQYKKEESQKKLEKTREHQAQVESLRKENAPHLAFLKRQVEKLAKARELREKLIVQYATYLAHEHHYVRTQKQAVAARTEGPSRILRELREQSERLKHDLAKREHQDPHADRLMSLERELAGARKNASNALHAEGRLEGAVAAEARRLEAERARLADEDTRPVPLSDVRTVCRDIGHALEAVRIEDDAAARERVLTKLMEHIRAFLARFEAPAVDHQPDTRELDRLNAECARASQLRADAEATILRLTEEVEGLRAKALLDKDASRDQERELFELMKREMTVQAELRECELARVECERLEEEQKREVAEAVALIGREALRYRDLPEEPTVEERSVQLERRRELEKLKIRLEEMGGADAEEITKEFEATRERDEFLTRELADLAASAQSLSELIADLDRELTERFKAGVSSISNQFAEFFTLMFGGGTASLSVVREKKRRTLGIFESDGERAEGEGEGDEGEEGLEEGIEIDVSLPKKRIKGLTMLSGGERALTSIALIFAMSQVNPPPFLILDETDAALDEANSKRYGDMIENLSKKSQLILITHNRETMSRAGMLYGVTMGADGVSKVLSVQLDEAVSVAK